MFGQAFGGYGVRGTWELWTVCVAKCDNITAKITNRYSIALTREPMGLLWIFIHELLYLFYLLEIGY